MSYRTDEEQIRLSRQMLIVGQIHICDSDRVDLSK